MKSLSLAALKSSFYIWQSRDTKQWSNPTLPQSAPPNITKDNNNLNTKPHQTGLERTQLQKVPSSLHRPTGSKPRTNINAGLLNKGNTCYVNSSLQCLSAMQEFWSSLSLDLGRKTSFLSAFLKIMSLLKTSKTPIDPSQFLRFLKQVLVKSGRADFNLFQQQDAAEILSCILIELCSESPIASDMISVYVKNTTTCSQCLQSNIIEDPCMILQLPVSKSVQGSIDCFLKPEELNGDNSYFCNFCSSLQPALLEHKFSRIGTFLRREYTILFSSFFQ